MFCFHIRRHSDCYGMSRRMIHSIRFDSLQFVNASYSVNGMRSITSEFGTSEFGRDSICESQSNEGFFIS